MTQTDRTTVKVTLEGPPELVDAVAWRINHFLSTTYTSKNRPKKLSDNVTRFLRVLPPGQAHHNTLPPLGGRGGASRSAK